MRLRSGLRTPEEGEEEGRGKRGESTPEAIPDALFMQPLPQMNGAHHSTGASAAQQRQAELAAGLPGTRAAPSPRGAPSSRFHMSIVLSCDADTILPLPTSTTDSAASLCPHKVYCADTRGGADGGAQIPRQDLLQKATGVPGRWGLAARRRTSQTPVSYCHTRTVQSWLADASLPACRGRKASQSVSLCAHCHKQPSAAARAPTVLSTTAYIRPANFKQEFPKRR